MRSQGLPPSFLPAHLGINYHPPLVVLRDGFMSAGTSRRGRPARHLANPCSSCSKREVERLSPLVSTPLNPGPFTRITEDSEYTAQRLPHKGDTCCMLRA